MKKSTKKRTAAGAIIGGVILLGSYLVSPHLTLSEATVTNTGIQNVITNEQVLKNVETTAVHIYEPCRRHFKHAIYPSSFFRCEKVNHAVGGVEYSLHLTGQAVDLDADIYGGLTNRQLYQFIKDSLQFDQLIIEGGPYGWVHCSYKITGNRHQSFTIPNP